jgi:hypothetical protein
VLRRILEPKREEDGSWRNSSPIIVRVIKSRKMRWAEHVARMGRGEALTWF